MKSSDLLWILFLALTLIFFKMGEMPGRDRIFAGILFIYSFLIGVKTGRETEK